MPHHSALNIPSLFFSLGVAAALFARQDVAPDLDASVEVSRAIEPAKPPTIIPWLEMNLPYEDVASRPGVSGLDYAREGLKAWAQVTDVAIVTTVPARVEGVYAALMRDKPANLHVIGGFKTHFDLRPTFHEAAGWGRLARAARRVVALTGNNVVVLENETALGEFHGGRSPETLAEISAVLRPLAETGLEFWWNMPVVLLDTPSNARRRENTAELTRRVYAAVPRSRFLTGYRAWAENPLAEALRGAEARMHETVPESRTVEKLQVRLAGQPYSGGKRFFTPAEALQELSGRKSAACIVYTGETDWVRVAEEFGRLMRIDPNAARRE
ncbi:MAG: hypothetical protein BroJett003_04760 [Planctomycetota bacterium]|nr:MAG: hypothetical protein BroJett003_04760 [Planctomycetota bacterium]